MRWQSFFANGPLGIVYTEVLPPTPTMSSKITTLQYYTVRWGDKRVLELNTYHKHSLCENVDFKYGT